MAGVGGLAIIAERRVASAAREPTGRNGDEVAISEGAAWAWGWFAGAWVQGAARQRRVPATEGD